ncbi:MAG: hypothetical protein LWX11_01025 [Firmicutes bacterium]|nr:hypothetical protein [Bacillota bacterium]
MVRPRILVTLSCLLLLGCASEDPRLPQSLLDEARTLSTEGKTLEARSLLERLAQQYPETEPGKRARQDLVIIEMTLKQEMQEKQRLVRASMRRIMDALTRYHSKRGEYPWTLQALVPEYLDLVPETPWGHPFLYRPYVPVLMEESKDRRGHVTQRIYSKLDAYHLVCLGSDLQPGGDQLAQDTLAANGEFLKDAALPSIPLPQPVR